MDGDSIKKVGKVGNSETFQEHRDGWRQHYKVGKVGKSEDSKSSVMDGDNIKKLEKLATVKIPRAW